MNPTQLAENTHDVDHAPRHRRRRAPLPRPAARRRSLMAVLFSIGAASAAFADTGAERDTGYETNLGALVGLGI
ncbi:hypothetical protein O1L55_24550 [Streptomyces albulus]|nr:hypothetical protein [Streptomyces noursei]